jgi:HlyD family secretion protein
MSLLYLAPLLLVAASLLTGCGDRSASAATADSSAATATDSTPPRPLDVQAALARQGNLELRLTATGLLRAEATSVLRSEVAATVEELPRREGQRVRRGDAVVVLDRRPFELALREAQSALAQARVQYEDQVLPDSLLTGRPASPERRQAAYARSGLQAAEARVERARLDLERAVIRAPFDGVVQRVAVAVGERLAVGQELVTLVDLDHLRVDASVLEHDLAGVRVGSEALVTTPAAPGRTLRGRVAAILPVVDSATRAARVLVTLAGDGLLRPGMSADVQLATSTLRDRLLVPASAVIERDGRPLVFVVREGRAQWTYVQPGRSNGRDIEIRPDSAAAIAPVSPGDTVLTGGHLTLTHDAPVRAEVTARRPE